MRQDPYILANLPKRAPVSSHREYLISIKTSLSGASTHTTSNMVYNLGITYDDHTFTFSKKNIVVDGKVIPSKMNELYLKSAAPLQTIDFRCDKQGTIIDIYKYRNLLKAWQQTRREIQQQFTGPPVAQLIAQTDECYNEKKHLIERLNGNMVLQSFYRSFINDYLIYYGQTNTVFTNIGILSRMPLPYSGKKTLGLKDNQLFVNTKAYLNKEKVNTSELESYFKNKVENVAIENLDITIEDRTFLDYDSLWINQSTVTKTVQLDNYKKEVILTIQHV